jgi:hypothetical protein
MAKKSSKRLAKLSKATSADADLILKLYDLRREATMREARDYLALEFWPQSVEDIVKVATAAGTDENRYFRQVLGYWDMAAALVSHGALNGDLFASCAGEMFFVYAKFRPHLQKLRKELGQPRFLQNVEEVAEQWPERTKLVAERVAKMGAMRKAAAGR